MHIDETQARLIARKFFGQYNDLVIIKNVKKINGTWEVSVAIGFSNVEKNLRIDDKTGKIIRIMNIDS